MGGRSSTTDRKIARIATRAWGIVTRRELIDADISEREIDGRIDRGALIREFPGVYRVGHSAPSTEASYMAAVKACGDGAALSGRAAGHLFAVIKGPPPPPEVTTRYERRIKGLLTKRSRRIETTRCHGIPVTTLARTLVDLAAVLSNEQLARACHEAQVVHRITPAHVKDVLARHPNAKGAATLRRILNGDVEVALSELERRFLKLLHKHKLPLPVTNRPVSGRLVDCRWPDQKLTVELDGYRYHNSRRSFEQDRKREREAYARGDQFRRYTWADVVEDARAMLRELRELLLAP